MLPDLSNTLGDAPFCKRTMVIEDGCFDGGNDRKREDSSSIDGAYDGDDGD